MQALAPMIFAATLVIAAGAAALSPVSAQTFAAPAVTAAAR